MADPLHPLRGVGRVLSLVEPGDRFADARQLLYIGELSRPSPVVVAVLVLTLLAAVLIAAGQVWAWSLIGAAVSLALSRYGPHWWPGRR